MCFVLYLGTDAELATSAFSPDAPAAFTVEEIGNHPIDGVELDLIVREHLSTPNVYHLGAHTGCGCGYGYGQDPAWYAWAAESPDEAGVDPQVAAQDAESRCQLVDLLRQLVADGHTVEVLADWSGFENAPPERRLTLPPDAFLDPSRITEGDFAVVTSAVPAQTE